LFFVTLEPEVFFDISLYFMRLPSRGNIG
jgi:hypothetical protein